MGKIVEIAKILVSPAEKLIDVIRAAIGKAYEPRYEKRMSDAKAYEITTVANALRDSSDIPITYSKEGLTMSTTDFDEFKKRTQSRLAYQELTKQKNIESVADYAYAQLEGAADVPNDPVDQDWINRFFNSVADVSNEDMQLLWGKILAGEVKQPGSFSLRTLETLRNMSKKDAELFVKIAPFLVSITSDSQKVLSSDDELCEKYGLSYVKIIMILDECGLINSSAFLTFNLSLTKEQEIPVYTLERVALLRGLNDNSVKISFGVHTLTKVGLELFNLIDAKPNNEYFSDFIKNIESANKGKVVATIHSVNTIQNGGINYKKEPIEIIKSDNK